MICSANMLVLKILINILNLIMNRRVNTVIDNYCEVYVHSFEDVMIAKVTDKLKVLMKARYEQA